MKNKLSRELRLAYLCNRLYEKALMGKGTFTRYFTLLKELNKEKVLNNLNGFLTCGRIVINSSKGSNNEDQ